MKLSFDWLSEFVDLEGLSAAQVAEKLTMGAFEVEEVTPVGAEITGPLVLGEILEINPHPNASKIRLTKTRVAPGTGSRAGPPGEAPARRGRRIRSRDRPAADRGLVPAESRNRVVDDALSRRPTGRWPVHAPLLVPSPSG